MAYLVKPEEEEQNEQKELTQAQTTTAPAGTPVAAAGTAQAAVRPGGAKSGFTNLQKYLEAAEGQGAEMVRDIGTEVSSAQEAAEQAVETYEASIPTYDELDVGGFEEKIRSGEIGRPEFEKYTKAAYEGPTEYTQGAGYEEALKKSREAWDKYKQLGGDIYEKQQLLRDVYEEDIPDYTAGESALDMFILGQDPAGQAAMRELEEQYAPIYKEGVDTRLGGATEAFTTGVGEAKDYYKRIREQSGQVAQDILGEYEEEVQSAKEQAIADTSAIDYYRALTDDVYGPEEAELGLSQEEWQFLKDRGYNLANIAAQGRGGTVGDFLTQERQAEMNVLRELMGQTAYQYDPTGEATTVDPEQVAAAKQLYGQFTGGIERAREQEKTREGERLRGEKFSPEVFAFMKEMGLDMDQFFEDEVLYTQDLVEQDVYDTLGLERPTTPYEVGTYKGLDEDTILLAQEAEGIQDILETGDAAEMKKVLPRWIQLGEALGWENVYEIPTPPPLPEPETEYQIPAGIRGMQQEGKKFTNLWEDLGKQLVHREDFDDIMGQIDPFYNNKGILGDIAEATIYTPAEQILETTSNLSAEAVRAGGRHLKDMMKGPKMPKPRLSTPKIRKPKIRRPKWM